MFRRENMICPNCGFHENMKNIKMLLWDVDGTLLNFLAAERVAIRTCFERFGLGECSDEMLAEYSEINRKYWKILERGEMTKHEILVGRFHEFFGKHGIDVNVAEEFNSEYQIRLGDTIVFHEEAFETVEVLRGRYIQCAVTNGTKIAQDRKLKASGLGDLFDYVFISEEVGFEKPAVEFFDAVASCTGVDLDETMIIGDSLTSDMQGGNNAGLITCWYNPEGADAPGNMRIDFNIGRLTEVMDILK